MKYRYCYKCGHKTEMREIDNIKRSFCISCNLVLYKNPIPSVAIVAFDKHIRLLLTKRAVDPCKGYWSLPGGFVESGENIRQAVHRELFEETNLTCKNIQMINAESVINGYWGDILILGFSVELINFEIIAGDDADEVNFFPLDNRPEIVFPIHETFVNEFLRNTGKVE